MGQESEVKFTYSGVIVRDNKNTVCVRFEQGTGKNMAYAEGTVPSCTIDKSEGFSDEEIKALEAYLSENSLEIIKNARKLNNIKNWF